MLYQVNGALLLIAGWCLHVDFPSLAAPRSDAGAPGVNGRSLEHSTKSVEERGYQRSTVLLGAAKTR